MGKPYETELRSLAATYSWALEAPLQRLVAAVRELSSLPLVAVGSGGSFTAAHFASYLHQHYTGFLAKPVTPLELNSIGVNFRRANLMILSAEGSNQDILAALDGAIQEEPHRSLAFSLRPDSRLISAASDLGQVVSFGIEAPVVKDGFLATNSLLAFIALLSRAYAEVFGDDHSLPSNLADLLPHDFFSDPLAHGLIDRLADLWDRPTTTIIYGPNVASAAVDLESKFTEAALGNTRLADLRNFAHGRHNWLATPPEPTAVLALFSKPEEALATRTLRLIPPTFPIVRLNFPDSGPKAALGAVIASLYIVGSVGIARGVDPGQPRVPQFGRRLYSLKMKFRKPPSAEDTAISRKLQTNGPLLETRRSDLTKWREAYHAFIERLTSAEFGAIILDYDGTLCSGDERFTGMRATIAAELNRILAIGCMVGIATGRGKSVHHDLRMSITPEHWAKVLIGYYNGSQIKALSEDPPMSSGTAISTALAAFAVQLEESHATDGELAIRPTQISVIPKSVEQSETTWRLISSLARRLGLKAVKSSHSIDVVEQSTSKTNLAQFISQQLPDGQALLAIGDQGEWPGNDSELLSLPYSLSVDEVSVDPETCWNIAPAGVRSIPATLFYLRLINGAYSVMTIDRSHLLPAK